MNRVGTEVATNTPTRLPGAHRTLTYQITWGMNFNNDPLPTSGGLRLGDVDQ